MRCKFQVMAIKQRQPTTLLNGTGEMNVNKLRILANHSLTHKTMIDIYPADYYDLKQDEKPWYILDDVSGLTMPAYGIS